MKSKSAEVKTLFYKLIKAISGFSSKTRNVVLLDAPTTRKPKSGKNPLRFHRDSEGECSESWFVECQLDTLHDGRPIQIVAVANNSTNEGLYVDLSMPTQESTPEQVLETLAFRRGCYPARIQSGHQLEFSSANFKKWCSQHNIVHDYADSSSVIPNLPPPSFTESLRRDCFDVEVFRDLEEARWRTERFVKDHNLHAL